jgi:deazaflavin-dependent oxidoreductase (nitroreductase family)
MWAFKRVATRDVDPILLPIVAKLPSFGIVTHRGRKSGRIYHTPVNVFRRGDAYLFFLTYGSDVEWVKNVLASGSCTLEIRRQMVDLDEPRLITDPELRPAPAIGRFIERRIAGVTQYLRMRPRAAQVVRDALGLTTASANSCARSSSFGQNTSENVSEINSREATWTCSPSGDVSP